MKKFALGFVTGLIVGPVIKKRVVKLIQSNRVAQDKIERAVLKLQGRRATLLLTLTHKGLVDEPFDPEKVFARVIQIPCPSCPAGVGQLCDTNGVWVHLERMLSAPEN